MSGGWSYSFTTPQAPKANGISTSRREVRDIAIAYAVLTFDLILIFSGSTFLFGYGATGLVYALTPGIVAVAATAGFTGFVAHELAHKFIAERRGFWAEFRMSPAGLALSLFTALIGFLWGAPGATVVSGMSEYDRADWGRTSVAGPLTNVAFGLAFLGAGIGTYSFDAGLATGLLLLAWINGWFGTFNLIPFGPLDGRKVLHWSVRAWLAAIVFTGAVAGVSIASLYSMYSYGTPFHYFAALTVVR
jgi:Zn-dependent protease